MKIFRMLVLVVVFLLFVCLRLESGFLFVPTVLKSPKPKDNKPVGEIKTGFLLEQPIDLNLHSCLWKDGDFSENVCISIFMANYCNRENIGSFTVALKSKDIFEKVLVDVAEVRDNHYLRFCFGSIDFSDLVGKKAWVVLEGSGSPRGKSVTAWMTKDTLHGEAIINGENSGCSLLFCVESQRGWGIKSLSSILLTIICSLSSVFPGFCSLEK